MKHLKKTLALLLAVLMIVGIVPVTALAEEAPPQLSVIVYYKDESGTEIRDPSYVAKLGMGDNYSGSLTLPSFENRAIQSVTQPEGVTRDGSNKLKFALTNVQADVEITVTYMTSTAGEYTVAYYLQNADDDGYTLEETVTLTNGVTVGAQPAITINSYEGFTMVSKDVPATAADGSSVASVYYDRKYYRLMFDLDGGFGVDNIYARYGSTVTVGTPTKPGFTFTGWDKTVPSTVPAENTSYKAQWETGMANYTVVYWKENADDDGYTYLGSETLSATVGANVAGGAKTFTSAITSEYSTINSFFHFGHTDEAKPVAADGSTTVNVYYDRNVYTVQFYIGNPGTVNHQDEQTIHHPAQDIEHPAVTHEVYHPAEYTEDTRTFTATIGALGTAVNSGNTTNTTNVLSSLHGLGAWTPLFTKSGCTQDMTTWYGLRMIDRMVSAGTFNSDAGCTKIYERTESGWAHTVPLRQGMTVTIDPSAIEVVNGVPTIKNSGCLTMKNSANATTDPDMKKAVPVSLTYEADNKPYSGYATKKYLTSITASGSAPTLIHEAWTETVIDKEAWTEHIDAWDEYIPEVNEYPNAKYYENNTSKSITVNNDVIPKITIGGQEYTTTYTFTAKYGQNIEDKWPTNLGDRQDVQPVVNGVKFKCMYAATQTLNQNVEKITVQPTLNESILQSATNGSTSSFYVSYKNTNYDITLIYRDTSTKTEEYPNGVPINIQVGKFGSGAGQDMNAIIFPGYTYKTQSNDGAYIKYFNYVRDTFDIIYISENEVVAAKHAVYKDPLTDSSYNFTPSYPSTLPEGYTFGGWYTDPGFTTAFDFEHTTMPANSIQLFAKWVPGTFNVRFFLTETSATPLDAQPQEVPYGEFADAPDNDPVRDGYTIVGWFYRVNGVEMPFEEEFVPIYRDMDIYAKWTTTSELPYTIHYVLQGTTTEVADPVSGTTTEGFVAYAKVNSEEQLELNRENCFPLTTSMGINYSDLANGKTDFYFEYVEAAAVPYTVKYINEKTGEPMKEDKVVSDNLYSYVTEDAAEIENATADEERKHLAVQYTDDPTVNVITFYYTAGASFTIIHSSDPENPEVVPYTEDMADGYDITKKVKEGYLYGGLATDETFAVPYTDGVGTELAVVADGVYYLREVDDDYLMPKILSIRPTSKVEKDPTYPNNVHHYLVTAVDGLGIDIVNENKDEQDPYYYEYGFLIKDLESDDIMDAYRMDSEAQTVQMGENDEEDKLMSYSALYDEIRMYQNDVLKQTLTPSSVYGKGSAVGADDKRDFLGAIHFENYRGDHEGEVEAYMDGDVFTFIPYFVTADGVLVTGTTERKVDLLENAATTLDVKDTTVGSQTINYDNFISGGEEPASAPARMPMMVKSFFAINPPKELEEEPVVEEPIEEEPVSEDGLVITAVVDGTEYKTEVEAGNCEGALEIPEVAGMRFVGWFADEAFTTPADFSDVQESMTVYGKYLAEDYFKVESFLTMKKGLIEKMTIASAIDNLKSYAEIGFEVTVDGETVVYPVGKVVSAVNNKKANKIFGSSLPSATKLFSLDIQVKTIADGSTVTMAPYYVTLDGTRVLGLAKTVVFYAAGLQVME